MGEWWTDGTAGAGAGNVGVGYGSRGSRFGIEVIRYFGPRS